MFTDGILESKLLLLACAIGTLAYWRLLGGALDARLFLAMNFSLITLWSVSGESAATLRLSAVLFMVLVVLANRTARPQRLAARGDKLLAVDTSWAVIVVSVAAILLNLQSGLDSIDAVSIVLEHRTADATSRYAGYVLLSGSWLCVHMICHAATQRRWSATQWIGLATALVAAATGLSKASYMPIVLTLLFVYARKLGFVRLCLLAVVGFVLTVASVQRLFDGVSAFDVADLLFARTVKNVEVLDYLDALGTVVGQYPHTSIWFPAWPIFQFTREDFVVPGLWMHGTLYNDWRGFGPNPTFVGDLLLASNYAGLLFAPVIGVLLRAADASCYRVFLAMVCYFFLQDWSMSCLSLALFLSVLALIGLLTPRHGRRHASRPRRMRLLSSPRAVPGSSSSGS